MRPTSTSRYHSFFWPALLILAGVIALLVNTGAIPTDRLYRLLDLWPLILIVIGLELVVRRTVYGVAGDVAAALIVLVAVVGAAGYVVTGPNPSATYTLDASRSVAGIERASLEINAGSATMTISGSANLGSDLYRAHLDYSGPAPTVDFNQSIGKLTISQPNGSFFGNRQLNLNLQLNSGVRWTMTENTGATRDTIDFAQLDISSLTLNTGASREDISLGQVTGTVPITVNGGALTVHVHRPSGVEASIQVSGGAVNLNADGRSFHAIGSTGFTTDGYADASDRYRISVNGGACTVTLDAAPVSA